MAGYNTFSHHCHGSYGARGCEPRGEKAACTWLPAPVGQEALSRVVGGGEEEPPQGKSQRSDLTTGLCAPLFYNSRQKMPRED